MTVIEVNTLQNRMLTENAGGQENRLNYGVMDNDANMYSPMVVDWWLDGAGMLQALGAQSAMTARYEMAPV